MAYLRALLLIKTGSDEAIDLTAEDIDELKDLAAGASLPQILRAVKLFGQLELSLDNYSTLPLEMALVDYSLPLTEERKEPALPVEPRPPVKKAATPPTPPPPAQPPVAKAETAGAPEPPPEAEPSGTPEPVPSATAKTPSVSVEPGSEIERLTQNWRQLIKEAPDDIGRTPAAALLRSAKPKAIEGNTIVLSVKFPYHKEKLEEIENQKIAERIISNFLGRTCQVRCVYEPEDNHLVEAALKIGAQIIGTEEK
ncbi:hypothetical protein ES703_91592 [subsurface metagenome]